MINITVSGIVSGELLEEKNEEETEAMLMEVIGSKIKSEILMKIEDISFIEINQYDDIPGATKWEAKMIIYGENQVVSSIGITALRMAEKFKASAEDIKYCLEPMVTDLKGF